MGICHVLDWLVSKRSFYTTRKKDWTSWPWFCALNEFENKFENARPAYEAALEILNGLRTISSTEEKVLDEYTERKVLGAYRETVFRLAELDHVQRKYSSAKTGYEEALQVDELLGHDDREGEEYTRRLLHEVMGKL